MRLFYFNGNEFQAKIIIFLNWDQGSILDILNRNEVKIGKRKGRTASFRIQMKKIAISKLGAVPNLSVIASETRHSR